jgi:CRISPR/Cas system-associated exonuclease Cas4 (RecB family)
MATSWSFSKIGDFEKCKKYFWLKHEQKIPEPERPLRPGQTEHANDRGSRIHDNCEQYVRGDIDNLAPEAEKFFGGKIDLLRVLHEFGHVELEGEWGMDEDWEVADWDTAWLRLKLDVLVHLSETDAVVIDYKTGKKFGNEVKHAQQLQLYALVTFLRYPELETVDAQLWYLDVNETTSQTFTRSQALRFMRSFEKRGSDIVSCTSWPANPNKYSCQWCLYGPEHSGHCEVGVRKGG